jgi:hypothetical protein
LIVKYGHTPQDTGADNVAPLRFENAAATEPSKQPQRSGVCMKSHYGKW